MSASSQNIGDEQAVVGEPASHPHQAFVVGEPPEDVAPVLGEPAFPNGLQDQDLILPASADETSANGVQASSHTPSHEEGLASSPPSSHVSAPSAPPFEASPDLEHVPSPEVRGSGLGEVDAYQLEPPVTENTGSDSHVDEAACSSDAPVIGTRAEETPVAANAGDIACGEGEELAVNSPDAEVTHIVESPSEAPPSLSDIPSENPYEALDTGSYSHVDEAADAADASVVSARAADIPTAVNACDTVSSNEGGLPVISSDVEITHIVDSPSEAPPSLSEIPSGNPFAVLDEGTAAAPEKSLAGDTPVYEGPPIANASSTQDEISSKGLVDQQDEESLPSAMQGKQSMENSASIRIHTDDDVPSDGSKDVFEDVHVDQGDALAQGLEDKEVDAEKEETGSSVVEHAELDQASEKGAPHQGDDASEETLADCGTTDREVGLSLVKELLSPETSTAESPSSKKAIADENQFASITSDLQFKGKTPDPSPAVDSHVVLKGNRGVSVDEHLVTQPPAAETSSLPAANGDNGYQHDGEDCPYEREQEVPKVDDASADEAEKPGPRSKLPLIFTGLAIAAVGVAVASISRPH